MAWSLIEKVVLVFSSIMLEALPFILIGALLSAFMQVYFSEEFVRKVIPKNRLLGSIEAGLLGLIFPICECATVPITKGLIKKKVPVNVAITYMLAAPIVNPLVIMSTYYAFDGDVKFVLIRVVVGFLIAVISGILVEFLSRGKSIMKDDEFDINLGCNCGCNMYTAKRKSKGRLFLIHASREFFQIGKYFIVGSILAAVFQVTIPKDRLMLLGKNNLIGILALMTFSFLVSLCSEADAFIASTFINKFSVGAITGFLIIGPMADLKNTIMLFSAFKKEFVFKLLFVVLSLSFIASCLII